MNKFILFFVFSLALSPAISYSQSKLYVGGEFGLNTIPYDIYDPSGHTDKLPTLGGSAGLALGYQITDLFAIETGVSWLLYSQSVAISNYEKDLDIGYSSGSTILSLKAITLPIRLKTRINLYSNKIFGVIKVGYLNGIATNSGRIGSDADAAAFTFDNSITRTIDYQYTSKVNSKKYFPLLETVVGFDFVTKKNIFFNLSGGYFTGFNQMIQMDVNYTLNNESFRSNLSNKGNHWGIRLGMYVPINYNKRLKSFE